MFVCDLVFVSGGLGFWCKIPIVVYTGCGFGCIVVVLEGLV